MPLTPSANPQLSESIPQLTTNSVAHPDTWNPVHQALLDNDAYLARVLEETGATLGELAKNAGIDAQGLEATVREFNEGAVNGEDRQFGRGTTSFNRYLADPEHKPNPCVAPVAKGPFYALKVVMGDLGTFDGLRTTVQGQVLADGNHAIPGLFAVGNDRASIMGGNYPGAGITLGPIMTFGYVTGNHIADLASQKSGSKQQDKQRQKEAA